MFLPGPGSLGTSKVLMLYSYFLPFVMWFGVCKNRYGIRMGWF